MIHPAAYENKIKVNDLNIFDVELYLNIKNHHIMTCNTLTQLGILLIYIHVLHPLQATENIKFDCYRICT